MAQSENIEVDIAAQGSFVARRENATEKTLRDGFVYEIGEGSSAEKLPDPNVAEAVRRIEEERYAFRFVKRAFDLAFSVVVLVLFCWLYAVIALAIKIEDPKGPVIFSQDRVGKNGKPFRMYKFRSMCVDAEEKLENLQELNEKSGPVFKIKRDPRITCVGRVIRKLSLDELPQFVNVVSGIISIVGPRPALQCEALLYTDRQKQRLLVKPGITCYWQTRLDRDEITFDEWVDLDLLYIKQCGIWADVKQIVKTVGVVLTAQGN